MTCGQIVLSILYVAQVVCAVVVLACEVPK